jgi:hypothetical protein
LLFALLFGVLAGLTLFVGANLGGFVDGICNKSFNTSIKQINELASKFISYESQVSSWTSQFMCTSICPCPPTVIPTKWNEERLNKYNRTALFNADRIDPVTQRNLAGF